MNIGLTSLTLRNYSVREVINAAKKTELDGIEWGEFDGHIPLGNLDRAREVFALTRNAGLKVFSFGSYFKLGQQMDFEKTLSTAKALHAPIIRVWAGTTGSNEAEDEYFNLIVNEAKIISDMANSEKMKIGFEYHANTLSDCSTSAIRLIKEINKENCRLYWQPGSNVLLNYEELKALTPYLVGNFHIHNYNPIDGYKPLCEIKEEIRKYFEVYMDSEFNCMIEFVKDHDIHNFYKDANVLKDIFRGNTLV